MNNTKNEAAWRKIFEKYKILENIEKYGVFEITSAQINEFREARLMTKFDHKNNLPEIFKQHRLSILPITRGSYLISQFEAYKEFEEKENKITKVSFPAYIETINSSDITSESVALNCAYISGILNDFLEDEDLLPTINGRMSSEIFSFRIKTVSGNNIKVDVNNSQIEIDGGYEGRKTFSLIEAKNSLSSDFLVRQIYYPYRLWSNKVTKKVKPIFLIYSNGIFTLYEYYFQEPDNYNSLVLIKQKKYSIEETKITFEDILKVFHNTRIVNEPQIPFPQADSFERVINLCELLNNSSLTKDEITANYDFDPRQTNYYTDAGRYLGLINKDRNNGTILFSITDEGRKLFKLKYKSRQLKLVELILSHKVFHEVFRLYITEGIIPPKNRIIKIMKDSNLFNVYSESTFARRASTITGWINWIFQLTKK